MTAFPVETGSVQRLGYTRDQVAQRGGERESRGSLVAAEWQARYLTESDSGVGWHLSDAVVAASSAWP